MGRLNAPSELRVDRSQWIGGSDAAGILGASRYETPLSVYLWKIGEPTEEMLERRKAMAKVFRRGKREEPHVISDLAEDYGVKVTKRSTPERPNRYQDPELPFLAAEVDFEWEVTPEVADLVADAHPEIAKLVHELVGTTQNGEVKTHHIFARAQFGDDGSDQVPIEYAAQALHGLMVTGRKLCMFGVRASLDDLRVYWIVRDDAVIADIRPRLIKFWHDNVQARVEPAAVRLPDIYTLFGRRQPISVEASPEAIMWLAAFEKAKADARVALEVAEEMKFQIGKFMLGQDAITRPVGARGGKYPVEPTAAATAIPHQLLINTEPALVINLQKQRRLDNDKVKKDYPEVAEACSYELKFFKFDKPKKPSSKTRKR